VPLTGRIGRRRILYPFTPNSFSLRSENVTERAETVWERSGRSSNFLRSVYELRGRAWTGWDSKDAPERRPSSKMSGGHPVLQLDEASTYLKRNWRTVYQTWNWVIFTWCETRVFPVFEKKPKMQNVHLKCWNDKSHCQVSVVGLKSPDVSPCNELLLLPTIIKNSHTPTHKSTFGVHYRTRSPGQLGLRVAGFPGDWVTKCDPVPCLLYTHGTAAAACFDRARTCYRDVLCRRAVRCHLTVSVRLH